MDAIIEKLHTELLPLVDELQDIGARGMYNLKKLPYGGMQWEFRAYQRDPFVIAFTLGLPKSFGTFARCEELLPQRRLVFHSDALNTNLVLRRRGSFGAFRRNQNSGPVQGALFARPEHIAVDDAPRLAALIWDTPEFDDKREAASPMQVAVRLAKPGRALDDNEWEAGFQLPTASRDDLIPERIEYNQDMSDWDVEAENNENDA